MQQMINDPCNNDLCNSDPCNNDLCNSDPCNNDPCSNEQLQNESHGNEPHKIDPRKNEHARIDYAAPIILITIKHHFSCIAILFYSPFSITFSLEELLSSPLATHWPTVSLEDDGYLE